MGRPFGESSLGQVDETAAPQRNGGEGSRCDPSTSAAEEPERRYAESGCRYVVGRTAGFGKVTDYLAYLPLGGRDRCRDDPAVTEVSARLGISVPRVWLAWTLAQGAHVTPLVGSSRPATIRESARASELGPSDLTLIDEQFTRRIDA